MQSSGTPQAAEVASPVWLEDGCEGNHGWAERLCDRPPTSRASRRCGAPWERQLILVFRYRSEHSLAEAAEDLGVSREHALSLQEDALCQVHDAMLAAASG
jgi:hypothetical protein